VYLREWEYLPVGLQLHRFFIICCFVFALFFTYQSDIAPTTPMYVQYVLTDCRPVESHRPRVKSLKELANSDKLALLIIAQVLSVEMLIII
jgi:hypothetical protein